MAQAYVDVYWTLPVNWAGFRDLRPGVEMAAAASKITKMPFGTRSTGVGTRHAAHDVRSTVIPVYCGIDVACAKRKALPMCFVTVRQDRALVPLVVPRPLLALVPRGPGNAAALDEAPFGRLAREAVRAIGAICKSMSWRLQRVAIDAPAAAPNPGPRQSEVALGRAGLSAFRTPSTGDWPGILTTCHGHIQGGGRLSYLPHANKIWMLFGFELFAACRSELGAEILEVYPHAIARRMAPDCLHKTNKAGYQAQLAAMATATSWTPTDLESGLKKAVSGSRHDRLDAFMAAFVASLPADKRRAYGNAQNPDDAIWVPV